MFEYDVTEKIQSAIAEAEKAELAKWEREEATPEGEVLTYAVTSEEVAKINAGEREAIDAFFFGNYERIKACAYLYLRRNRYLQAIITWEDLVNQLYVDLAYGSIKLRPYDRAISSTIFHSYRYAAVGGAEEIYVYEGRRSAGECQKQAS